MNKALVSIIVPIYNEAQVLPELCSRLFAVIMQSDHLWEVLFVDDGSSDETLHILRHTPSPGTSIRVIELSRNFGQQAAITAGLEEAEGEAVIVMDGDLQDPPELIPRMLDLWHAGAEVVYGVRRRRPERLWLRIIYHLYYRMLRFFVQTDIPADAGDFCLMDHRVVRQMRRFQESHCFLRGLRAWVGYRQEPLEYSREVRRAGKSKYTLRKLWVLGMDGLLSFSSILLRVSFFVGAMLAVLALAVGIPVLWRVILGNFGVWGTDTLAALVLFIGALQMLFIGVLSEYVGRIDREVRSRPRYIVKSIHIVSPLPNSSESEIGGKTGGEK